MALSMLFSRRAQYAAGHHRHTLHHALATAAAASAEGRFAAEIVGVPIKGKKGDVLLTTDEEFSKVRERARWSPFHSCGRDTLALSRIPSLTRRTCSSLRSPQVNFDKIPTLKPAFKAQGGTVTAANASSLNDGGAAVVLMSGARAAALGLKPLARIRGFADAEQAPIDFPTAPAKAVPVALARAGVRAADIDFHEVNEAFSVVVLANARKLGIDVSKINVNGGAVALGHPIGCSGARIVVTLLNVLTQRDATLGTASICNGGGGGSAIVIERLR